MQIHTSFATMVESGMPALNIIVGPDCHEEDGPVGRRPHSAIDPGVVHVVKERCHLVRHLCWSQRSKHSRDVLMRQQGQRHQLATQLVCASILQVILTHAQVLDLPPNSLWIKIQY